MFIKATIKDVPFIADLIEKFYAKHQNLYEIEFVRSDCEKSVRTVIEFGICLVGPSSCAGATLEQFFVNHGERIAFVWFWAFTKSREIKILEALMKECKLAGATHMSAAAQYPKFTILKHYSKLGLKPLELQSIIKL